MKKEIEKMLKKGKRLAGDIGPIAKDAFSDIKDSTKDLYEKGKKSTHDFIEKSEDKKDEVVDLVRKKESQLRKDTLDAVQPKKEKDNKNRNKVLGALAFLTAAAASGYVLYNKRKEKREEDIRKASSKIKNWSTLDEITLQEEDKKEAHSFRINPDEMYFEGSNVYMGDGVILNISKEEDKLEFDASYIDEPLEMYSFAEQIKDKGDELREKGKITLEKFKLQSKLGKMEAEDKAHELFEKAKETEEDLKGDFKEESDDLSKKFSELKDKIKGEGTELKDEIEDLKDEIEDDIADTKENVESELKSNEMAKKDSSSKFDDFKDKMELKKEKLESDVEKAKVDAKIKAKELEIKGKSKVDELKVQKELGKMEAKEKSDELERKAKDVSDDLKAEMEKFGVETEKELKKAKRKLDSKFKSNNMDIDPDEPVVPEPGPEEVPELEEEDMVDSFKDKKTEVEEDFESSKEDLKSESTSTLDNAKAFLVDKAEDITETIKSKFSDDDMYEEKELIEYNVTIHNSGNEDYKFYPVQIQLYDIKKGKSCLRPLHEEGSMLVRTTIKPGETYEAKLFVNKTIGKLEGLIVYKDLDLEESALFILEDGPGVEEPELILDEDYLYGDETVLEEEDYKRL